MYVKIIDCGECFSTTMEFVNGVYANKTEWAKHNFYPQNNMVGEVVKSTPSAYIVKIKEGIYVPMTRRGIKEISYNEYIANMNNNICSGMNDRQKKINMEHDSISGNSWQRLPNMRQAFETDIVENMKKLTCDFKRNIYLPDLEKSAIMYATDMCLEYSAKSGRNIDPMTSKDITKQITDVYCKLFPGDFTKESVERCKKSVADLLVNPSSARNKIDNYYNQVNSRYSWY